VPPKRQEEAALLGGLGDATSTLSDMLAGELRALTRKSVTPEAMPEDLEVEVAVEELDALEAGGAGDAVDGLQDRVDLELVGLPSSSGEAGLAGGGGDQALELGEQAGDLLQAALGDVDDLVGALGVG
jgi:hypothetical protein